MNKIIYIIIPIVLIAIFVYTLSGTEENNEVYTKEIQKERAQKDKDFKENERISPLKPEQRAAFKGLLHFEPNITYKVEAGLEVLNEDSVLTMITTTGEKQKYVRYAYAHFTLQNQKLRLTVYKSMDRMTKGMLFLPFNDNSNSAETYGAGRYIEVKSSNGSTMTIDFNKAYNPYCAYNEAYSCPIPPKENSLNVSILAGEKIYQKN
jgi:uncharacterized protein (DUF1684 family)